MSFKLKVVLIEEGEEFPDIIGLSLPDIAKITAERLSDNIKKFLEVESERGIHIEVPEVFFFIFKDSFVPPHPDFIDECSKAIFSLILRKNLGRGEFSLCSESESFIISLDPEPKRDKKEIFRAPFSFRLKTKSDWTRALHISKKIKNDEVSQIAFLVSPDETFISFDSQIEKNAVIFGDTFIISSFIGESSVIYPGNHIIKSKIGSRVSILPYCYIEGAEIEEDVQVGPFARMRPHVSVGRGAKIGNFAEIKNSQIGENSKIQHFSYIGDTKIGRNVNIGAGTVTCNWDGIKKNPTDIGDFAFIGSGSMLVAPLKIGDYAYIGAGSTITKDVPPYALAVERSEQKIIPDWRKRRLEKEEKLKNSEENQK
jgi:bifunctional UDP-N-acetylglucosamine pyrophosphorylase/glucosamine-1-phosphate N-acetyltransferase